MITPNTIFDLRFTTKCVVNRKLNTVLKCKNDVS